MVTDAGLALRQQVEAAWAHLERITVGSLPAHRVSEAEAVLADLEANLAAADPR